MAVTFTITQNVTPVEVVSSNPQVSYQQIVNSLDTAAYAVDSVYIFSSSPVQAQQPIFVQTRNANGVNNVLTETPRLSNFAPPGNYAINLDWTKQNIQFNGFTFISFNVLPGENVTIIFDGRELTIADRYPEYNLLQQSGLLNKPDIPLIAEPVPTNNNYQKYPKQSIVKTFFGKLFG